MTNPPKPRTFQKHRIAVSIDFGERKAQPGEARNVEAAWIGKVAASQLAPAFQQVSQRRATAPVAPTPANPIEIDGSSPPGKELDRWRGQ